MFLIFRFNSFIFRDLNKNSRGKRPAIPPDTQKKGNRQQKEESDKTGRNCDGHLAIWFIIICNVSKSNKCLLTIILTLLYSVVFDYIDVFVWSKIWSAKRSSWPAISLSWAATRLASIAVFCFFFALLFNCSPPCLPLTVWLSQFLPFAVCFLSCCVLGGFASLFPFEFLFKFLKKKKELKQKIKNIKSLKISSR